jgi:hypothetical protein
VVDSFDADTGLWATPERQTVDYCRDVNAIVYDLNEKRCLSMTN